MILKKKITGSVEYTYSAGILIEEVHKNATEAVTKTLTHSTTNADHCEFYSTYSYGETSGNLTKKFVYNAFGSETSDALESYTDYEYETKLGKEIIHDGDTSATILESILYTYSTDGITKKTFYQKDNTDPEYWLDYTYDSGNISKTEKFFQDDTDSSAEYREMTYNGNGLKTKEITYVNPGDDTRILSMDISINEGLDVSGYYNLNGTNYELDGKLSDNTVELDESDKVKDVTDALKTVFDNSHITLSKKAVTVNSDDGGSCRININADVDSNSADLKVTYNFSEYKSEEYIINGTVTKKLTATLDTGKLSQSSFTGTLQGSLNITDTEPNWESSDYIRQSHINYEYDTNGNCIKETKFTIAGKDNTWDTLDDTFAYRVVRTYTEDEETGETSLTKEDWVITCGNDYYINFIYDEDNKLIRKEQFRDFGTCTITKEVTEDPEDSDIVVSSRFIYQEEK